jgi:integrase
MPRPINRLSTRSIAAFNKPGRYADGAGLYLHVQCPELKRWVFVYQWEGQRKELGLGKLVLVSLSAAREAALAARKLVFEGKNPKLARDAAKKGSANQTFLAVAETVLKTLESELNNDKHLAQWRRSLTEHAKSLGPLPVDKITTEHVLAALRPIWEKTPESASRTRGRIERVLDVARAQGYRSGENPARWKGHLDLLLPKNNRTAPRHHPALPFSEVGSFLRELRDRQSMAARALEFLILTGVRTNEAVGARWDEIDVSAAVWTIPASRMKARVEHRVPLSASALAVLQKTRPELAPAVLEDGLDAELRSLAASGFVFPGTGLDKPLSNMSMEMLLRRMKKTDFTVHGFRSSFRDWAGDETDHSREVVEAALAHTVGTAVERAYRRGDALAKRRVLMDDWANYLADLKIHPKPDAPGHR